MKKLFKTAIHVSLISYLQVTRCQWASPLGPGCGEKNEKRFGAAQLEFGSRRWVFFPFDEMKVEQRVEPAKKAAQMLHKKLQGCMQSQTGIDAEKRMVRK